jgi:hypothetical protein
LGRGSIKEQKVTCRWGERAFLEEGLYRGVEEISQHGKGELAEKENFPQEDMSLGRGEAMARDVLHS